MAAREVSFVSTEEAAAKLKLTKSERKARRKVARCARIIRENTGVDVCDYPTRFLVLNNCGMVCGGSYEAIYSELHCYGSIQDILLIPGQPFAVVVFEDVDSSAAAASYLSSNVPTFAKDPVFPAFIERALRQREVRHFGYAFDYSLQGVQKDAPLSECIPSECAPFLDRLVAAGHLDRLPDQLTVTRYLPGQGIPPHVDSHESFDDDIVLLSLGSSIVMNFRHPDGRQVAQVLPPCSALILSGDSRYVWSHGIASRKFDVVPRSGGPDSGIALSQRGVRVSYTFRHIRRGSCKCGNALLCDSHRFGNQDNASALRLETEHVYKVYENIAEQFSDTRYKQWPKVAEFLDSLEQGSLLLDAGCGNGKYLTGHDKLLKLGFDRSQRLCDICWHRGLEVLQADVLQMPFRRGVFDACISIAVLHHLSTIERREAAVREILRVLRPGGRALVYVWALEQNNPGGEEEGALSKYLDPNKAAANCESYVESPETSALPVHCNRTQFQARDMLVPWHSKNTQETHYRYYHLFQHGELRELLESVAPGCVETEYHDQGNWCAVIVKQGLVRDKVVVAS
ncbi:tRNA (carboxymethyluridine(34)-5-O)-methyltransferase alkbh8 isoform X2 [Dermacentor andersoni]|uniref:tRNA (carboxymethyluridine(34)-5-O)-methyltransferase alkbh8 isoform X2 n=1 Tax=Dermacentor andersoni TaxID=34620 RepID=UPI003B3B1DE7